MPGKYCVLVNLQKRKILVYGTNDIAVDLVNAITFSKKYRVAGFVSDSPRKSLSKLAGFSVVSKDNIEEELKKRSINFVVIANKAESQNIDRKFLVTLDQLGVSTAFAPTMDKAFDYEVQLRSVDPEDLLQRPRLEQLKILGSKNLVGKTVLVTGAGGSIGGELVRQILKLEPTTLIIADNSEFALYSLEQEICNLTNNYCANVELKFELISVTDKRG